MNLDNYCLLWLHRPVTFQFYPELDKSLRQFFCAGYSEASLSMLAMTAFRGFLCFVYSFQTWTEATKRYAFMNTAVGSV